MKLLLLGMNHRSAPLEVRERVAVEDPAPLLRKLVTSDEIDEAVLLSTCNRLELVVLTRDLESARLRLRSFLRRDLGDAGPSEAELDDHCYEYQNADAMRHVFRVASALDSMVVGEPQILGQTKEAYRAAVDAGASGPVLGRLFERAFATAKRVRTETGVAERPVSVARVAVDLARHIFEDFSDKRALLVGAGEMIEQALHALRDAGLEHVAVANRTPERAARLATHLGASAHALDELPRLLADSDVVLTSIGGNRPWLDPALAERALVRRQGRPVFVIDIGVPRNVDPAIDRLDDVYRYDIDDLAAVADENAAERRKEQARAEQIVETEGDRFDGWFAALRAVPTIKHLRARVEAIRVREVERALARLPVDDEARGAVEALTRGIVNKILHAPLQRLREAAERDAGMAHLETARLLFDLDRDAPEDSEDTADPNSDREPESR
ncbi:MAG: glutamyl-tRNA reductase [Myxococcota bacterium]